MSDDFEIAEHDDFEDETDEEEVEYEAYVSEGDSEPYETGDLHITVYGGKRGDVKESIETHLDSDTKFYQTWITLSVLKRLGFLFETGVEGSGDFIGIICMFIAIIAVFALFFFWQFVVFFIVIGVLTLFSGGAALRYLRATFIEAKTEKMDFSKLESFAREQVEAGRFVKVDCDKEDAEIGPIAMKASSTTRIFELGIYLSLGIATLFLVFQVVYWVLNRHWISGLNPDSYELEIFLLAYFGLAFLLAIIIMDLGVYKRGRLETDLSGGYSELNPPSTEV
jgi:hypothetical protein